MPATSVKLAPRVISDLPSMLCTSSCTALITDVMPYTVYELTLMSVNENGNSLGSFPVYTIRTPPSFPEQVMTFNATAESSQSIRFEWVTPQNNGDAISEFRCTFTSLTIASKYELYPSNGTG